MGASKIGVEVMKREFVSWGFPVGILLVANFNNNNKKMVKYVLLLPYHNT